MPEKDHNVVGMEVRQLWERGYEQLEKKQWDYAMELLCMALEKEPAFFECRMALRAAQVKKNENASSLSKMAGTCLLYTSPSPRDLSTSRMPSSA